MNTTRIIEATTLTSIGALCAAAIFSLAVQSAQAVPSHKTVASVTTEKVQRIEIVGKRLTPAEKAALRNQHVTL